MRSPAWVIEPTQGSAPTLLQSKTSTPCRRVRPTPACPRERAQASPTFPTLWVTRSSRIRDPPKEHRSVSRNYPMTLSTPWNYYLGRVVRIRVRGRSDLGRDLVPGGQDPARVDHWMDSVRVGLIDRVQINTECFHPYRPLLKWLSLTTDCLALE